MNILKQLATIVVCGGFMVGCVQIPKYEQTQVKQNFHLGEACPANLSLAIGEKIGFSAPENATTGYQWQLKNPLNHLSATSYYVADAKDQTVVGSGGIRHFEFSAKKAGTETIQLDYVRTWEKDKPAESWQCQVSIK
ncbi:protease inhibitor I42 family protein [Acinetobacter populi]|uniref:Proteinase inhibitor I42 chagasin domain-containing protein n=1 Tax=Acinetobacter populi TaxID=1582270 RepID=A0A1Z9Z2V9_9GAMM|nr:protease inhibitor I42 family protein [Acinetobacter populi]OUY08801.1 hypothetical protein CAP51_04070 [Acinetobacter populi]